MMPAPGDLSPTERGARNVIIIRSPIRDTLPWELEALQQAYPNEMSSSSDTNQPDPVAVIQTDNRNLESRVTSCVGLLKRQRGDTAKS